MCDCNFVGCSFKSNVHRLNKRCERFGSLLMATVEESNGRRLFGLWRIVLDFFFFLKTAICWAHSKHLYLSFPLADLFVPPPFLIVGLLIQPQKKVCVVGKRWPTCGRLRWTSKVKPPNEEPLLAEQHLKRSLPGKWDIDFLLFWFFKSYFFFFFFLKGSPSAPALVTT